MYLYNTKDDKAVVIDYDQCQFLGQYGENNLYKHTNSIIFP